ncbi:hypothetical protein Tco_1190594, partial [Tanacetum coccineum]
NEWRLTSQSGGHSLNSVYTISLWEMGNYDKAPELETYVIKLSQMQPKSDSEQAYDEVGGFVKNSLGKVVQGPPKRKNKDLVTVKLEDANTVLLAARATIIMGFVATNPV